MSETKKPTRITLRTIRRMVSEGKRFACLTCYEATMARWLQRAGLPMILVGDTLAEIVLGYDQTYYAPMDVLVAVTAGVRRGAPDVVLMADMPFMSYQADDREALHNAARFMTEAGADLVKLEVDQSFAPLIAKMTRAGIPVVAHVGSRPQQTKISGGYRSSGRTPDEAAQLVADARACEAAGAVMLLIEATPAEVSAAIVAASSVPVIGCGAGPACHGQVVVLHDLLGLTDWQPKFAKPLTNLGEQLSAAVRSWIDRVDRNDLGEHPYKMQAKRPDTVTDAGTDGETQPKGLRESACRTGASDSGLTADAPGADAKPAIPGTTEAADTKKTAPLYSGR